MWALEVGRGRLRRDVWRLSVGVWAQGGLRVGSPWAPQISPPGEGGRAVGAEEGLSGAEKEDTNDHQEEWGSGHHYGSYGRQRGRRYIMNNFM